MQQQLEIDTLPTKPSDRKTELGQFMTPDDVATFMVSLFPVHQGETPRLLDPGAGEGALSRAFVERFGSDVEVTAIERDPRMVAKLTNLTEKVERLQVIQDDFVHLASSNGVSSAFTHAILNPPYKKIRSNSAHRQALSAVGIETVNLYAAFAALSIQLLQSGGHLVAIIPRSFCNGPYFRPFREFLLEHTAIHRIHLYESRVDAFKSDMVLQENVILHLQKAGKQGDVCISTSRDQSLEDMQTFTFPFERIVLPSDPEQFIHVPTEEGLTQLERSPIVDSSLKDVGVKLSTGPVVDFRVREHLKPRPTKKTAPLLYPLHFSDGRVSWPKKSKKPNAIVRCEETNKWLYAGGHYCVVRRFSSKEERRRVVASVVEPSRLGDPEEIGFENHLNVFHVNKSGLAPELAWGLAAYLNTSAVDEAFRRFNGNTQVNATDLKRLLYPSVEILTCFGTWAQQQPELTQDMIDLKFKELEDAHSNRGGHRDSSGAGVTESAAE